MSGWTKGATTQSDGDCFVVEIVVEEKKEIVFCAGGCPF